MRRRRSLTALVTFVLLGAACAHSNSGRPTRNPNVITEDEIVRSNATDAYNAIMKLRADFLTNRGPITVTNENSSPYPTVYVDGTRYGDISVLRTIPASQVAQVRLYRSWEAETKYGHGNLGGVLEITTRR